MSQYIQNTLKNTCRIVMKIFAFQKYKICTHFKFRLSVKFRPSLKMFHYKGSNTDFQMKLVYGASMILESPLRLVQLFPLTALTESAKGRGFVPVFSERNRVIYWKPVIKKKRKICLDFFKEVIPCMNSCVMLQNTGR